MLRKMIDGALSGAMTMMFLTGILAPFNSPRPPLPNSDCLSEAFAELSLIALSSILGVILGGGSTAASIFANKAEHRKASIASFVTLLSAAVMIAFIGVSYARHDSQKILILFSAPLIWSIVLFSSGFKRFARQSFGGSFSDAGDPDGDRTCH